MSVVTSVSTNIGKLFIIKTIYFVNTSMYLNTLPSCCLLRPRDLVFEVETSQGALGIFLYGKNHVTVTDTSCNFLKIQIKQFLFIYLFIQVFTSSKCTDSQTLLCPK